MNKSNRRAFISNVGMGTLLAATSTLLPKNAMATPFKKNPPHDGPVLLHNISIPNGEKNIDIHIADGVISAIGKELTIDNAEIYDCKGALLLPSFVDPHVHLDKTRIGGPRIRHEEFISVPIMAALEKKMRQELNHDPFIFGSNLVRQLALNGTTHIRSHIDVDSDIKLKNVEALLKVKEQFKGYMDIELVAFPQSGVVKDQQAAQYMHEAINMGVDIVGGIDPQTFDNDLEGNLNTVFKIAEKTGSKMDLHIHERNEIGFKTFKGIIERAKALGMDNMINISHGYALGQMSQQDLETILKGFSELNISVATSAQGDVEFPPVDALYEANILYSAMSDNIQDFWSPWGDGDQLRRASLLGYITGFYTDKSLMRCFDMVTKNPATMLGLQNHDISDMKVGMAANFTAVFAEDIPSAVLCPSDRLFTMKDGRFTVRDGEIYMP